MGRGAGRGPRCPGAASGVERNVAAGRANAPAATVRLNAEAANPGEVLLGFGPMACDLNLSATGDLAEAAANLFTHLHSLDATGRPIAVAPVPDTGLGRAINDRLRRAAAPRPDRS